MGAAFYDTLRHGLYRWLRVYDDADARERIDQMTEWAEDEDPDSYEIPKLEPDLPNCLKDRKRTAATPPLESFAAPPDPSLYELVATTIELHQVSRSVERPTIGADFLDQERESHSLDSPLPSVLLYFHAGDAVTACFDNECEYWGQETPEPNLIIPIRTDDPNSVRQALAVVATLHASPGPHRSNQQDYRGTGEIQMRFSIDVGGELELKLFQAALLYRNSGGNRHMATVHNIIQCEAGGVPSLGPGQLLSMAGLRELTKLLGTGCPVEVLPQEVLARTPDMLAWWTPAASRTCSSARNLSWLMFPASSFRIRRCCLS